MRLFPVKPQQRPERGSVRSAAGEMEVCGQGKTLAQDALGALPEVTGAGMCQTLTGGLEM